MSLNKLITHSRRYELVAQRMTANHQAIAEGGELTVEQCIDHMKIMEEGLEALADITSDYYEIVKEKEKIQSLYASALRVYAKEFGSHIISERDVPDGVQFRVDVTLLPLSEQFMSVDIIVKGEDYDCQYFRRRTRYQKIRDWFILVRQIFRKSQG